MNDYSTELLRSAYIRGYLKENKYKNDLIEKPLFSLSADEIKTLETIGYDLNLKNHYFKDKEVLARVKIVLGFLRGVYPESLLDVGSGRGAFLFPLLKEFSYLDVTSIDILDYRVKLLRQMHEGGISNLKAYQADICDFIAKDNAYDVVTMLEVLEHIPNVLDAIKNAIRISKKFIVITVPSKEDDNPEHLHLLTKEKLTAMFNACGVYNLKFDGVNGHLFLVARKQ